MAARKKRPFECSVVNESVEVYLRRRRGPGFGGEDYHFVQCNQPYCQYVDKNEPPCPLRVEMFEDEVQRWQKRRERSRDEMDY